MFRISFTGRDCRESGEAHIVEAPLSTMPACSFTCACTPSFPSSTAPTASTKSSRPRRPTASPRWRSPTSTTSSAPSSSTRKRAARASSRCSAPRSCSKGLGTDAGALTRIVLLVQNKQGYLNLSRAAGARLDAERRPRQAQAVCKLDWLRGAAGAGLIALSGAQAGPLGAGRCCRATPSARREIALQLAGHLPAPLLHRAAARRPARRRGARGRRRAAGRAAAACRWWRRIRCSSPPRTTTRRTRRASASPKARSWATSAACASSRASSTSSPRPQMEALFADVPSARSPTRVEIAKRCNLTLELGKPQLPNFPTPNGMPIEEYFRVASLRGPGGAAAAPVPRRGAARRASARATWSGWSSRSTPS